MVRPERFELEPGSRGEIPNVGEGIGM